MLQPFIVSFDANGDGVPFRLTAMRSWGGGGVLGGGSLLSFRHPGPSGPHGMFSTYVGSVVRRLR